MSGTPTAGSQPSDGAVGGSDLLGRGLRDLRVSLTDRCNFRCTYCMPREVFGPDFQFLPRSELLSFEEITLLVRAFARLGVRKVRLTGGEPLLRREVERLVATLAAVEGIEDLAMTTNGSLLAGAARRLADAGMGRVTVSLDSVRPETFAAMTDSAVPLERVLEGIAAAEAAGLGPVKVNAVVRRGVNDGEVTDLARFGREHGHVVRFIEYMDVGTTNGWRLDEVVPAAEILERVAGAYPLEALPPRYPGEVATRYRYLDGGGEVGVIASVTQPFCGACTRARLSATGELYTCLFASRGTDLRALVRAGTPEDGLVEAIASVWGRRDDRYSELRTAATSAGPPEDGGQRVEMSYIGG